MGKNEVIEVVAEAEELVEHKGYLYLNGFFEEQSFFYINDEYDPEYYDHDYELIAKRVNRNTETEIALYLARNTKLPKYNLQYRDFNEKPIESFHFSNFLDLNQFLSKNTFFKLIIEASQCD